MPQCRAKTPPRGPTASAVPRFRREAPLPGRASALPRVHAAVPYQGSAVRPLCQAVPEPCRGCVPQCRAKTPPRGPTASAVPGFRREAPSARPCQCLPRVYAAVPCQNPAVRPHCQAVPVPCRRCMPQCRARASPRGPVVPGAWTGYLNIFWAKLWSDLRQGCHSWSPG